MLICIDYDDTYSADPEMWSGVIELMRKHGHHIICATMRYPEEGEEVYYALHSKVDAIIYTGREAKKQYLEHHDYRPDVWIDDSPEWILNNSQ